MRTTISVPLEIFDRVSERATALGMTRSQFFTRAAQRYLVALDAESLTVQIDSALEILDGPDETQDAAVAAGRRLLDAMGDGWWSDAWRFTGPIW